MKRQKKLTWFTVGYGQLAIILPRAGGSPRYFAGAISWCGLMTDLIGIWPGARGDVRFIDAYNRLAEMESDRRRLTGFRRANRTCAPADAQAIRGS